MFDESKNLDLAKAASSEIYGKDCAGCGCSLDWVYFRRDSSSRDGHSALCDDCEAQPILSTSEHIARKREQNYNSEAIKKQRWEDQEELKDDESRVGRPMKHTDFLSVVQKLVPCLYVTEGRIQGHLAIYQVAGGPKPAWDGNDYKYLFFCPSGILPEFSQYEFDPRTNVPIRESNRGWRTVLLRLIKCGLLTEDTCNRVFGRPEGKPSNRWHHELWKYRNK